jgi:hypothetical protein
MDQIKTFDFQRIRRFFDFTIVSGWNSYYNQYNVIQITNTEISNYQKVLRGVAIGYIGRRRQETGG